jgi:hypothetical protein
MNSERLNRWLTFVANLGVIGGLFFLGYEIRQNTSQMRAEAAYSINESQRFCSGVRRTSAV